MESQDYIELGNYACDHGEYEQAIEAYSRVIETGEHLFDAYTCRAVAYEQLGNWQSAVDDYTNGIANVTMTAHWCVCSIDTVRLCTQK